MADTLPNTILPPGVWVDLYDDTGITVGCKIIVQNIGVCDVYLVTKATEPSDEDARQVLQRAKFALNDNGDSGAWAKCLAGGAVNVRLP